MCNLKILKLYNLLWIVCIHIKFIIINSRINDILLISKNWNYFLNWLTICCTYRSEGGNLVVHFEIRFDPRYQTITTADIVEILTQEINPETSKYLTNLTIELPSLEVQESLKALNAQVGLQTTIATPPPTTTPPPPRRCTSLNLSYCKHLPYNVTSYPNILGHRSLADVQEDVIAFRCISLSRSWNKFYQVHDHYEFIRSRFYIITETFSL